MSKKLRRSNNHMLRRSTALYTTLGLSTLDKLRITGGGPPFIKIGRRVIYDRDDVDVWLASRRRRSTSDSEE